jgi:hypothetical protein
MNCRIWAKRILPSWPIPRMMSHPQNVASNMANGWIGEQLEHFDDDPEEVFLSAVLSWCLFQAAQAILQSQGKSPFYPARHTPMTFSTDFQQASPLVEVGGDLEENDGFYFF